jgi:hypothetical protein
MAYQLERGNEDDLRPRQKSLFLLWPRWHSCRAAMYHFILQPRQDGVVKQTHMQGPAYHRPCSSTCAVSEAPLRDVEEVIGHQWMMTMHTTHSLRLLSQFILAAFPRPLSHCIPVCPLAISCYCREYSMPDKMSRCTWSFGGAIMVKDILTRKKHSLRCDALTVPT